jgi:hypothetical protein
MAAALPLVFEMRWWTEMMLKILDTITVVPATLARSGQQLGQSHLEQEID